MARAFASEDWSKGVTENLSLLQIEDSQFFCFLPESAYIFVFVFVCDMPIEAFPVISRCQWWQFFQLEHVLGLGAFINIQFGKAD